MERSINYKKYGYLALTVVAVLGIGMCIARIQNNGIIDVMLGKIGRQRQYVVVIDAGHGGIDPGKLGVNGSQEKDINLQIAQQLKCFLESADVKVVLTRNSDEGLYDESASNKKVQDMKKRVSIIEETKPDLAVSIHQNSYHDNSIHGAQVFYYASSITGKELAECIQQGLVENVDPDNRRLAKANDSYYLLKKTGVPLVIVECGFLSNMTEAEKLSTDYYQEKVAWSIHLSVMQYLNEQNRKNS